MDNYNSFPVLHGSTNTPRLPAYNAQSRIHAQNRSSLLPQSSYQQHNAEYFSYNEQRLQTSQQCSFSQNESLQIGLKQNYNQSNLLRQQNQPVNHQGIFEDQRFLTAQQYESNYGSYDKNRMQRDSVMSMNTLSTEHKNRAFNQNHSSNFSMGQFTLGKDEILPRNISNDVFPEKQIFPETGTYSGSSDMRLQSSRMKQNYPQSNNPFVAEKKFASYCEGPRNENNQGVFPSSKSCTSLSAIASSYSSPQQEMLYDNIPSPQVVKSESFERDFLREPSSCISGSTSFLSEQNNCENYGISSRSQYNVSTANHLTGVNNQFSSYQCSTQSIESTDKMSFSTPQFSPSCKVSFSSNAEQFNNKRQFPRTQVETASFDGRDKFLSPNKPYINAEKQVLDEYSHLGGTACKNNTANFNIPALQEPMLNRMPPHNVSTSSGHNSFLVSSSVSDALSSLKEFSLHSQNYFSEVNPKVESCISPKKCRDESPLRSAISSHLSASFNASSSPALPYLSTTTEQVLPGLSISSRGTPPDLSKPSNIPPCLSSASTSISPDLSTASTIIPPGLDAVSKSVLNNWNEPEEFTNSNLNISDHTENGNDWLKDSSIPFIGENNGQQSECLGKEYKDCDNTFKNAFGTFPKLEKNFEASATNKESQVIEPEKGSVNNSNIFNLCESAKDVNAENNARSALEEALDALVTGDPIVGLDYIIEHKQDVFIDGTFPFQCKLCNSSISRSLIIDHIIGAKHRMRYLKATDLSLYNYIMSLNLDKDLKEKEISEAAAKMEKKHGRGYVLVDCTIK
ncbi:uncharacterized protein LOC118195162, partial [Stegodyphus dumicola]|uniref:uncharacterized protein LOC118195162 n=1 Tax=Stegodyphus dumicola TaxID=202533 RepID=UPI0015B36B24